MKIFEYEFVRNIPAQLELDRLYISIEFATAVHLCACGCGEEVVTPLSPTDWRLIFDGETVSLSPSIGNWSYACHSHYWIQKNRIVWDRKWSHEEIEAGREVDRLRKNEFYSEETPDYTSPIGTNEVTQTLWKRIQLWWRK